MKLSLIVIAVVALAVFGWFVFSGTGTRQQNQNTNQASAPAAETQPSAQSEKAPDFHLQDYSGKTVNLSDFAGKPLIINAWASWCPFCRQELPDFATAQKEFGSNAVIIAIDRAESLAVAKGYTDQQGTTGKLIFLLDPSDSFYQSIGGFSMPETIFVDKNGVVVDHKRGPMGLQEMRERAQKILAAATASAPTETQKSATSGNFAVKYGASGFSPSTLRVKTGAIVAFTNNGSTNMWVASNPHPIHTAYPEFDAKRGYGKGETYSFTFVKTGTWKYHNHLNPGDGGTVIVE